MRTRERRNGLNSLMVLIAVCALFFFLFANVVTNKFLFVPGPASYASTEESIRFVEAGDGTRLVVFWAPVEGATKTVYFFHGNAEDLGDVAFLLNNYRLQGVSALSYDYRGFGLSEGKPSERSCYADAETVLDYAIAELGIDSSGVVLHGRSVGSGVAMELATRRQVAGLILESAFLSAYRLYLPFNWVPGDKFVNAKKAPKVDCPTLLIHGRADRIVPISHGEELATLIDEDLLDTLWIRGAGHNDLASVGAGTYWSGIRAFFSRL